MLHASLGWAHAVNGDTRQALASAERAGDARTRPEADPVPYWLRFFDSAELQALRGMTLAHLPHSASEHRTQAIERFSLSNAMRELPMARTRTFELTALSWLTLDEGATAQAVRVGHQAVDLAEQVRVRSGWWTGSRRCGRRSPVGRRWPISRDLAHRIAELRGRGHPDRGRTGGVGAVAAGSTTTTTAAATLPLITPRDAYRHDCDAYRRDRDAYRRDRDAHRRGRGRLTAEGAASPTAATADAYRRGRDAHHRARDVHHRERGGGGYHRGRGD